MFHKQVINPLSLSLLVLFITTPCLTHAELQHVRVGGGIPPAKILVTERGVIPDDGKDDTAALQSVLDSVKWGTEITFPTGTYEISRTLNVLSNTELIGDEKGGTVLHFTGATPCPFMEIRNGSHINVFDLTFDAAMNPNATQGIVASQSSQVFIQDVTIRNFSAREGFGPHAIFFADKVTDSVMLHCIIENIGVDSPWGAGMRIAKGSSRIHIDANTIRNTGRGGILCNESPELFITKNVVSGSHGEGLGIELWGGCPKSIVEDNTLDHWLSVDKSPQTAIRRNKIGDTSGTIKAIGLELVDASDCVFTDNTVDSGQQIGISISNTGPKERIYWARNTIRNCVTWNAQIQGEADGATGHVFRQNTFEGALLNDPKALYPDQGYGVRFNGDCHNLLFLENNIIGNGHGAIQTCGANLTELRFVRNTIRQNHGPALTGNPGTLPCWSENQVSDNADNAVPETAQGPCTYDLSISPHALAAPPNGISFSCATLDKARTLKNALWDFGAGIPQTGLETVCQANRLGKVIHVTVIAWDENGVPAVADTELTIGDLPTL